PHVDRRRLLLARRRHLERRHVVDVHAVRRLHSTHGEHPRRFDYPWTSVQESRAAVKVPPAHGPIAGTGGWFGSARPLCQRGHFCRVEPLPHAGPGSMSESQGGVAEWSKAVAPPWRSYTGNRIAGSNPDSLR